MLHPARRETWVSPRAGTALLALEAAGKEGIALSQKKKKKQALCCSGSGAERLVPQRTPLDRKVAKGAKEAGLKTPGVWGWVFIPRS